ncbi:MAG: matrixin family metalloprotease, partial [Candidatus Hydrogenedentes bacterium]|nr:matrixin family metalloprotease [Candidatus Hydrogenedentota bacterium]
MLLAAASPAYYHFIHYTSPFSPYAPIPEKFNLDALPGRVLQVFVSDQGPVQLAALDSFAGVASQIRLAASTWDNVGTSELRVAYAGLSTPGTSRNTPGVEIVFEEVPPGLVAMGGPTVWGETVTGAHGSYVPITRSMVIVRNDLTQKPSFGEGFFMTMVHELGHALGLQHSLTSATMSTDYTRATTRGRTLATDDMVALSLLYPAPGFLSSTGAISGRVAMAGQGVHLASVVALPPSGTPVSALTNPDGSYLLQGLPVGPYYVYVHPLPPTELASNGIRLPVDADAQPVAAGGAFASQFYPGTRNTQQAVPMSINAGSTVEGVDFAVEGRAYVPLYGVTTYSYPGQTAIKPAFISDS